VGFLGYGVIGHALGLGFEKVLKPLTGLVDARLKLTIFLFRGQQGFSKFLVLSSQTLQGR